MTVRTGCGEGERLILFGQSGGVVVLWGPPLRPPLPEPSPPWEKRRDMGMLWSRLLSRGGWMYGGEGGGQQGYY